MLLLNNSGLNIDAFEPVLAAVLGNEPGQSGYEPAFNVLGEASLHGRGKVALRDWLYCLAKSPATTVRREFIDALGKDSNRFAAILEDGLAIGEEPGGMPPERITPLTVEPAVVEMLAHAEKLAKDNRHDKITDGILTLALLRTADEELTDLLSAWLPRGRFQSVVAQLSALVESGEIVLWTPEGDLNPKALRLSASQLCRRIAEDTTSLGFDKVTSRHVLYTLLGDEKSPLSVALLLRGVDVKKDLHGVLTRELTRRGAKRKGNFVLSRETMYESVAKVLEESAKMASVRGAPGVTQNDICRAFVTMQANELSRLFPSGHALDLPGVRDYLASMNPDDEEEEDKSARRFSIKEIEQNIANRIHGQPAALKRVIPAVKRLRFGLPREGRPAGVFLFLGPTGTGKTQMAKELARYVFGDEDAMIFIEMGHFKTKESMNMFIGAPPGYVGYGDGKLTNGLRDKPESVVLFDEIEKADKQVFDTILRFADEGLISDPAGPVRDGRKCIIVMTTNAGQAWLRDHLAVEGSTRDDPGLERQLFQAAMDELKKEGYRPEFLGRIDDRITFMPFTMETCRKIVDSVVNREIEKFREHKGVTLEVNDEVRDLLAQKAYERSLDEGARGAPRAVEEFVTTKAIDKLTADDTPTECTGVALVVSKSGLSETKVEVKT